MQLFALVILLAAHVQAAENCPTNIQTGGILYIGDSISLPPYNYSKAVATSLGTDVARFAVGGSAAKNWLNHFKGMNAARIGTSTLCASGAIETSVHVSAIPEVQTLLGKKPKAVVIALGTNDVADFCVAARQSGIASASKQVLKPAAQLAHAAKAVGECMWLLPIPYTKGLYANDCRELTKGDLHGFAAGIAYLKEAVEADCKVETTKDCPIPTHYDGIGVHPSSREGKELGECMGQKLKAALADTPAAHQKQNTHNLR